MSRLPAVSSHVLPQLALTVCCTFEGARKFCIFLVYFNGGIFGNQILYSKNRRIRKGLAHFNLFTAEKFKIERDVPEMTCRRPHSQQAYPQNWDGPSLLTTRSMVFVLHLRIQIKPQNHTFTEIKQMFFFLLGFSLKEKVEIAILQQDIT